MIIGDSLTNNIDCNLFYPDSSKIKCSDIDSLQQYTESVDTQHETESIFIIIGINDVKAKIPTCDIMEKLSDTLSKVQNKFPNAAVKFSSILCKPSSNMFNTVS